MRRGAILASLALVLGGLSAPQSATAAPTAAPATPPPDTSFQKVTLNDFPGEPVSLAVLPDNRVLHTARTGEVRIHNPRTGLNTIAANVPVYEHDEEGLQGVAIDPDFSRNKWVYLYYSPPLNTPVDDPATPSVNEGDAPTVGTEADWQRFRGFLRLSRFKLAGDTLKLDTEQRIIDVPVDRGICCHVGGQIDFDSQGNLYLSTGDDTNPFDSSGYTPIDERADRNPAFDAQRSSGNTNDLRGKLLRIRVKPGGGYTIPEGNLFPVGKAYTRPEIYAMGLRNPFRFAVDRRTDNVYMADYSPDASAANPDRGPAGHGRWMVIDRPANYGWPYCVAPDMPYVDYDFATGESGEPFDCRAPINDSPHNTGLKRLPRVEQPEVWYPYGEAAEFPGLGTGGIGPMAGPAYVFDSNNKSATKWPAYYDGVPLFYEWTRDYIKEFRLDRQNQVRDIRPVVPSIVVDNPMDMEFGPDGALYVLEYGDGYFAENPDAQLSRIDFVRGNRTPIPKISANPGSGAAPLTVSFSSVGTTDPDGDSLSYAWDFDADGKVDSRKANPTFTYTENGSYLPTVKVTDVTGRSASASLRLVVGPGAPTVEFVRPVTGQAFQFGQQVPFEVRVTDDAPVDCARVKVTYILGHNEHGHPISSATGCTGTITTSLEGGHGGADNLSAVFVAEYTDAPTEPGAPAQTGTATVVLRPTAR
ncbi:PKD domain-containing protein [Micromonospora pattaloongensis]|uniref:PKD domain-containing protein n=1 Tax=Micromonospora pattaloongensis TaxID=405436 RepID=A0A1H3NP01_9ACTN|nr:PQQ-dependent sugar dehydrogenase [Micromonospora pattaloongensis]SDY89919.1 PKD domain-containing protein [Micromonospora pattaloongensis]